jgi:DNA-binding XRE family transcriptional regulator
MGVLQTITSPSGDELVVITREEYDRLTMAHPEAIEDAIDIASADAIMDMVRNGEMETFPASFVTRICAGENRVLVWREHRGLSQRALAKAAGVSPGHLSDIEHGRRSGSVDALKRIAAALKVRIDDLIA